MAEQNATEAMRQRVRALSAAIDAAKENNRSGVVRSHPHHRTPTSQYPYSPRGRGRGRGGYYSQAPPFRNMTLHVNNSNSDITGKTGSSSDSEPMTDTRPAKYNVGHSSYQDDRVVSRPATQAGSPLKQRQGGTANSGITMKNQLCRSFCQTGNISRNHDGRNYFAVGESGRMNSNFIIGQCRKGSACPFIHDPSKVAICKEFLSKGICHKDPYCDLSHSPTPNRVPLCSYFARGSCTNSQCRYAHTVTNPQASICVEFANLGYCEAGANCANRHEHECPEYSSTGSCSNPKCRLPHIDRAGQLRHRNQTKESDSSNTADANLSLLDSLEAALRSGDQKVPEKELAKANRSKSSSPENQSSTFSQQDNFLSLEMETDGSFEQRYGV